MTQRAEIEHRVRSAYSGLGPSEAVQEELERRRTAEQAPAGRVVPLKFIAAASVLLAVMAAFVVDWDGKDPVQPTITLANDEHKEEGAPEVAKPLYKSSVVGTDYDFIMGADPSTFARLEYKGLGLPEMPDKRNHDWPLRKKAHIFVASFKDKTHVQISVHAGLGDERAARREAMRYAPRIGKLPTVLRKGLRRVVVQPGGRDTTAFADDGLFVLYADNASKRIASRELEETIFHEAVHASWDKEHRGSEAWRRAQARDRRFLTQYAARNPQSEDLAESALFAYTLLHHPERFPPWSREAIRKAIPARIAFVEKLLPPEKAIHFPVESNLQVVLETVSADLRRLAEAPDTPVHDGWRKVGDGAHEPRRVCNVNLNNPGELSDILSNALIRGLRRDEKKVAAFLQGPETAEGTEARSSSAALLRATAKKFGIKEVTLFVRVMEFLHCNCKHPELGEKEDEKLLAVLSEALMRKLPAKVRCLSFDVLKGDPADLWKALEIVRTRLAIAGFEELRVGVRGKRLAVEVPREAAARETVTALVERRAAHLEFHVTVEPGAPGYAEYWRRLKTALKDKVKFEDVRNVGPKDRTPEDIAANRYPRGLTWYRLNPLVDYSKKRLPESGARYVLCANDDCNVTEASLASAYYAPEIVGAGRGWSVYFDVAPGHRKNLERLTRPAAIKGRSLAIILDGTVRSAPVVHAPLFRSGRISGGFTKQEARALAALIRVAPLPVQFVLAEVPPGEPRRR